MRMHASSAPFASWTIQGDHPRVSHVRGMERDRLAAIFTRLNDRLALADFAWREVDVSDIVPSGHLPSIDVSATITSYASAILSKVDEFGLQPLGFSSTFPSAYQFSITSKV